MAASWWQKGEEDGDEVVRCNAGGALLPKVLCGPVASSLEDWMCSRDIPEGARPPLQLQTFAQGKFTWRKRQVGLSFVLLAMARAESQR